MVATCVGLKASRAQLEKMLNKTGRSLNPTGRSAITSGRHFQAPVKDKLDYIVALAEQVWEKVKGGWKIKLGLPELIEFLRSEGMSPDGDAMDAISQLKQLVARERARIGQYAEQSLHDDACSSAGGDAGEQARDQQRADVLDLLQLAVFDPQKVNRAFDSDAGVASPLKEQQNLPGNGQLVLHSLSSSDGLNDAESCCSPRRQSTVSETKVRKMLSDGKVVATVHDMDSNPEQKVHMTPDQQMQNVNCQPMAMVSHHSSSHAASKRLHEEELLELDGAAKRLRITNGLALGQGVPSLSQLIRLVPASMLFALEDVGQPAQKVTEAKREVDRILLAHSKGEKVLGDKPSEEFLRIVLLLHPAGGAVSDFSADAGTALQIALAEFYHSQSTRKA